jgi:hypothetical protein
VKQFLKDLKDWLLVVLVCSIIAGSIVWPIWRAYRQYQVEQVILDLKK